MIRELREYLVEYWRHGWASYGQAKAVREAVVVLITAATLFGVSAKFSAVPDWVMPVAIAGYVAVSLLVVWPFRLWRDLRTRLRSLEVTKRNQGVLDEIADLRERLIRLRIEMQKDAPKKSPEEWAAIYHDLENQIAKRIELFASHAEAVNCRARGNITRRTGDVPPHQLYIDLCRWRTKDRTGGREVARQSAKRTSGLIALSPLPR